MLKKNKIKQNSNLYLIIIFLLIIFLIKLDFFRNLYFLNKTNYNERMEKIYGYCEKESYGFLTELKSKYKFDKNPKILNSEVIPSSNWILYDSYKENENYPNILLNYQKNPTLNFQNSKNKFVSEGHVQSTNLLQSIKFNTINKDFLLNGKIKIYNNSKKIIYETKINETISDKKNIYINFKTEIFNSRWENYFIDLENYDYESNNIDSIVLTFKNKYLFKEEDIIFSKGDCFYIK